MRLQNSVCLILLLCFAALGCDAAPAFGQGQPSNAEIQKRRYQAREESLPYRLSSRFHIQKGTNQGYVVVRVVMDKDHYIYSLDQKGDLSATSIKAVDEKQFRLKGRFNPDKPAKVIEKDEVLKQRVEKHTGEIQFFAPIELVPGADVKKLTSSLVIDGQVCKEKGYCMPIMNKKIACRFAGYFERSAKKRESSQSNDSAGNLRR